MHHESVLLKETIEGLNIKESGTYVDATLGYAGHSSQILKKIKKRGYLFAFDQDDEAVNYSNKKLNSISSNYKIFHDNFVNMKNFINKKVDGIIFDLGVSSVELDSEYRGFSYQKNCVLDMRMDRRNKKTAKSVVNNYSKEQLENIFFKYGEEKYSKKIASAIVKSREVKPIETTYELSEIIKKNVPISYRNKKHPARKVFQAIRIEVNDEINILESSIKDAFDLLNKNGRLCIITFHSLEDRIVKKVFKELTEDHIMSKKLPIVPDEMKKKAILITKKPILPTEDEIKKNNRSRSAKLRIIEKL